MIPLIFCTSVQKSFISGPYKFCQVCYLAALRSFLPLDDAHATEYSWIHRCGVAEKEITGPECGSDVTSRNSCSSRERNLDKINLQRSSRGGILLSDDDKLEGRRLLCGGDLLSTFITHLLLRLQSRRLSRCFRVSAFTVSLCCG